MPAPPRNSRKSARLTPARPTYWDRSREPLQVLVFLLPLIVAYEIGLVLLHGRLGNVAHLTLLRFFEAFGIPAVAALYMGGLAIVVILLTWHVLTGHRWRVKWPVIGMMALESAALAMPLVLLSQIVATVAAAGTQGGTSTHMTAFGDSAVAGAAALSGAGGWLEPLVVSLGAGLYEELLFRMLLIGILHTLLVDVAGASNTLGCIVAIVVSAAAFAWYHTIGREPAIPLRELIFLFLAGLYFGAIYLTRGFGIVVGAHAVYDVVILMFHGQ